jgi:signal transduction histidine kinase
MAARDHYPPAPLDSDDFHRLKSEFLSSLNDEIRSPLTGIVGMTDLLLETRLDDGQRECVLAAKSCAGEALEQLGALLEFASLAAGRLQLEEADFDLPELLKSAVALQEPKAAAKGLRLFLTVTRELPALAMGDAMRLQEVLTHLLANAIKFTPQGEIELKAGWQPLSPATFRLELNLRDTGIGIPPGQLRAMFECFRQGDSGMARRYSGLGLGLALVRELAHLMRGQVDAESAPGQGAVFSFRVPLRISQAAPHPVLPLL